MTTAIALHQLDTDLIAVLNAYGYSLVVCDTCDALDKCIAEDEPTLGIYTLHQDQKELFEIPHRYPEIKWIAFAALGWAAEYESAIQCGFADIMPLPATASNLFETLYHLDTKPLKGNSFSHARFRWLRQGTEHFMQSHHDVLIEKLDELSDNAKNDLQAIPFVNPYLDFTPKGSLIHTHFAAILHTIGERNLTGTLHLWRASLHWIVYFSEGDVVDIQTSDCLHFFESNPKQPSPETVLEQLSTGEITLETENHLPNGLSLIFEVFTWPDGNFEWIDNKTQKNINFISHSKHKFTNSIIIQATLKWIPMTIILEVTHSCLSNFLKLKDNVPKLPEADLSPQVTAVVEKLTKGDNLTEMVAAFPNDYPVHQVVYLCLILGHIDLLA